MLHLLTPGSTLVRAVTIFHQTRRKTSHEVAAEHCRSPVCNSLEGFPPGTGVWRLSLGGVSGEPGHAIPPGLSTHCVSTVCLEKLIFELRNSRRFESKATRSVKNELHCWRYVRATCSPRQLSPFSPTWTPKHLFSHGNFLCCLGMLSPSF